MKKYIVSSGVMFLLPVVAFAAADTSKGLGKIIRIFSDLINILVPVVISLAVLFFLYGLAMYIWKVGEEKESGKDMMIWGIIGLFVMVSIWGLVNLLGDTLGLDENINIVNPIEQIPSSI
ncbi:pilin [Patescibacteria group bacterium]|nr:pilin [Patescibacteria group bacterium]MCG2694552.1 pilin [Candidatus Parcubacteria bacterium]